MKKFSLITIPLLCAAISPLCADGMRRHSRYQPQCEPRTDCMKPPEICCPIVECFDEAYNPPAGIRVDRCVKSFVTAAFILWKAHEDGLNVAFSGTASAAGDEPFADVKKGKVIHPGHKYQPGFKVGFGLKFPHGAWDLYANYTWLHTSNSGSNNRSSDEDDVVQTNYFLPSFPNSIGLTAQNASAHWRLRFNVLDLELGRNFYNSKYLTLRPHFGFKFSWMKQKLDVDYDNIIASGVSLTDLPSVIGNDPRFPMGADVDVDFKQRQFGVGIRTGLDTAWLFNKHFSLFGDVAFTGLWSHFHENRKDTVDPVDADDYDTFNIKDSLNALSVVFEFELGLRYEMTFCCERNLFWIQAGWEQQFWLDQNHFFRPMTTNADDLTFQGLTAKVGLAF